MPIKSDSVLGMIREYFRSIIEEVEAGRPDEVMKYAEDGMKFLDYMDDVGLANVIVEEKMKEKLRAEEVH